MGKCDPIQLKSTKPAINRSREGRKMESKASISPSHSNSSRQQQFYLAVDRIQFKMGTLKDALRMARRRPSMPIVLCCNTRDELEYVYFAVSKMSNISCAALHSDMAAADRASTLEKFRQAVINWRKAVGGEEIEGEEARKCQVMVVTDVCLPLLGAGESPISAHILINYELPAKKEAYMRRMATCLAADGVVINMVAGGEVVSLRNIEVSCGIVIPEMPINMWFTLSQEWSTTYVIN